MEKTREHYGKNYHLAVVQRNATAPPGTEEMLREILDEMGAQGNYSFHPIGPLEPVLQIADPRVTARIEDGVIVMNLRWGAGPEKSVRGTLYLPNGNTPPQVLKEISRKLVFLNDEWPERLGINGSKPAALQAAQSAAASPASPQPIKVAASNPAKPLKVTVTPHARGRTWAPHSVAAAPAHTSAPKPPAATPVPTARPTSAAVADKDEALALEFFTFVGENGIVKYQRMYDHCRGVHRGPDRMLPMGDMLGRLEAKGMLRRVSIENASSKWQFTESFLEKHGLTVAGYTPLPEAAVMPRGGRRERAVALERASAPATSAVEPQAAAAATPPVPAEPQSRTPSHEEESCPGLDRLRDLYGKLDTLEKRHKAAKICLEAAEQEVADIARSLQSVQTDIAAAKEALSKDDLLKLVLHR